MELARAGNGEHVESGEDLVRDRIPLRNVHLRCWLSPLRSHNVQGIVKASNRGGSAARVRRPEVVSVLVRRAELLRARLRRSGIISIIELQMLRRIEREARAAVVNDR